MTITKPKRGIGMTSVPFFLRLRILVKKGLKAVHKVCCGGERHSQSGTDICAHSSIAITGSGNQTNSHNSVMLDGLRNKVHENSRNAALVNIKNVVTNRNSSDTFRHSQLSNHPDLNSQFELMQKYAKSQGGAE